MNYKDEQQLKLEIAHIFESGANELRVLEMIKTFIDRRYPSKEVLTIDRIQDYHLIRWNNGIKSGASMEEIREDMKICKNAMDLYDSLDWDKEKNE